MRWVVAGAVALALGLSARANSPQVAFHATAEAVVIDVSVERRNRPVRGLGVADFVLTDNGQPQAILDLSIEPIPLDLFVLIDDSLSMDRSSTSRPWMPSNRTTLTKRMTALAGHAQQFARDGDHLHALRLGSVTQEVQRAEDLIPVKRALRHTSLFDGLATAVMQPRHSGRRRVVVALTDGLDTSSVTPYHVRAGVFDRADAAVSVIAIVATRPSGWYFVMLSPDDAFAGHAWELRDVAERTGGRLRTITPDDDFAAAIAEVIEEFRTRYVIRYRPERVTPGGWHDVKVQVSGRKYDIRHRTGYWWPDEKR